jgi:hypothetical protein
MKMAEEPRIQKSLRLRSGSMTITCNEETIDCQKFYFLYGSILVQLGLAFRMSIPTVSLEGLFTSQMYMLGLVCSCCVYSYH